jgi:hypothetical protein
MILQYLLLDREEWYLPGTITYGVCKKIIDIRKLVLP